MKRVLKPLLLCLSGLGVFGSAQADIVITEVDPAASGNAPGYAFDWFELTNTGSSAVDITGWKFDDSSNLFSSAVALTGITSIAAGQSVIFGEGGNFTNFVNNWFGGTAPPGFTFGTYSGSGVGLSTNSPGDAVNIYNATGTLMARIDFGAVGNATASLDNSAGLNNVTITTFSASGVNGAYAGLDTRIGSPGSISAVPVPAGIWLLSSGLGLLGAARRRATARKS